MSTETTTEITDEQLEAMSDDELAKLNSELDVKEQVDSQAAVKEETAAKLAKMEGKEPESEVVDNGPEPESDANESKVEPVASADTGNSESEKSTPEVVKHVSPPGKWIANRHAAKAKAALAVTERELAEAKAALDEQSRKIELLKSQGVKVDNPLEELFSDEKMESIREEFGDDLANMMAAAKLNLVADKQNTGKVANKEAPPEVQQQKDQADMEVQAAIERNDTLFYWQTQAPDLFDKAVSIDAAIRSDPANFGMTYDERFKVVVENVTKQVLEDKKQEAIPAKKADDKEPPLSLSGTGSVAAVKTDNIVDRVLGMSEDEAFKALDSLPDNSPEKQKILAAIGL